MVGCCVAADQGHHRQSLQQVCSRAAARGVNVTSSLIFKLLTNLFLYATGCKWHVFVQCTELVPAVAAGVIQWARIHWPAEKICQSVELCDAATLTTTQARFTSLSAVHQAMGLSTLVIAACCCLHSVLPFASEPCCHIHMAIRSI